MKFLMLLGVALCCFFSASAFPTANRPGKLNPSHVPSSACVDMTPVHNDSLPSTEPPPYTVTPSVTEASPGDIIQVLVSGVDGAQFRGLYMQARKVGGGHEAVGEFPIGNLEANPAIRISDCPPGSKNAITYISRTPVGSLSIDWKVPEGLSGDFYFKSTFVETFSRFWTNVDSHRIRLVEH